MNIGKVILNIDPVFGSISEENDIESFCMSLFKDIIIRKPTCASFGGAVKWAWSEVASDIFLHMEDDWILTGPVNIDEVLKEHSETTISQVILGHAEKKWSRWRKGVWFPRNTTSPSFLKGSFGRHAASLMNPDLDPEKQFYNGSNNSLESYADQFKVRFYGNRFSKNILVDTGRKWRDERQIEKIVTDGKSTWKTSASWRA